MRREFLAINQTKATRADIVLQRELKTTTTSAKQRLCFVYLFRRRQKTSGSLHAAETIQQLHI